MKKNFILTLGIALATIQFIKAQQATADDSLRLNLKRYNSKWEYNTEYLAPTANANQFSTVNASVYFWKRYFKHTLVMINVGAIGSYAKGYVGNKWVGSVPDLHLDKEDCSAIGAGPSIQFQYTALKIKKFSLEAEANGSFLVYNRKFPAGGFIYNFMFRTGPNFCWDINENFIFKAGYRWMHVSNGTGTGDQNPFYEGQGLSISLAQYIR